MFCGPSAGSQHRSHFVRHEVFRSDSPRSRREKGVVTDDGHFGLCRKPGLRPRQIPSFGQGKCLGSLHADRLHTQPLARTRITLGKPIADLIPRSVAPRQPSYGNRPLPVGSLDGQLVTFAAANIFGVTVLLGVCGPLLFDARSHSALLGPSKDESTELG